MFGRVLREAAAAAKGQPVVSILTILMVAGMCIAVLMTQGRAVGTQQAVVGTLDDAGTRTIVVRASAEAGLDTSVLERLQGVSSVADATAFGPAVDATNTNVPGGTRVALRDSYGFDTGQHVLPGGVVASDEALELLGMQHPAGSITTHEGREAAVVGSIDVPEELGFLEPVLVAPADPGTLEEPMMVSTLVVTATDAQHITSLQEVIVSVLGVVDPEGITIDTSAQLAELRTIVDGQLSGEAQTITAAIFALAAVLVAAVTTALVMMRRRDYGRRRALGASQRLILALVLAQSAVLAGIGGILGAIGSFITLTAMNSPVPGPGYFAAVIVLSVTVSVLASVFPAFWAARREPARELRVP
ncbi:FtsX-like permease family protein [uncultured Agrococcus sp.]|uniref:FtsX-like permease family protein n=1 Tax=uncultured Agrococcus sp. TaxID=382258 RepID=UPI0025CF54E5|nr:FtsX-like permease family protein [uncultured Agrococcus sp.]